MTQVVTKLCINMKTFVVKVSFEIFREGEVGHEMYIIVSGEVALTRAGRRVHSIKNGDCFGDAALLEEGGGAKGTYRTYTAKAITDVNLCFLTRDIVFSIMEDFPSLRDELRKVGDLCGA